MEPERCALLSRDLGEALAGTAVETLGWIAVEHPGPWSPKAPTAHELGSLAAHLGAVPDVRLQLIRPVHHQHVPLPQPEGHTVLLAHAAVDPDQRWVERLRVRDLADLVDVDPSVVLSPRAPGIGEPVDHDVWLVCTHARRDACCAVHGRPVAAALDAAGVEVWETTHTGGHRFAATAIVLPDGLSLGRLDEVDTIALAVDLARGDLPPALVRGRCAVPRPLQAAEVTLREHLGTTARDGVLPAGHHAATSDDRTVALLDAAGARWSASVHTTAAPRARPVSDAADPSHPTQHAVDDLRPAGPPTSPPVGSTVWINESKWPDDQHWRFPTTVLGTDVRGTWLGLRAGTVAQRGDEPPRELGIDLVLLVPPSDPWLVECYRDHPEISVYVNIGTPPRWDGDRVRQVDLDLDVVLLRDGTVRVDDRDEFDDHRRTRAYPRRLVDLAEDAAGRAHDLLTDNPSWFEADVWFERLADLD